MHQNGVCNVDGSKKAMLDKFTMSAVPPWEAMDGCGFYPKKVWKDALKYVIPSLCSKMFGWHSSEKDVLKALSKIREYLESMNVPEEVKEKNLAGFRMKAGRIANFLSKNRGACKLILDHGGNSRIVMQYILQGARASSLEVFFGRAYDLSGEFVWLPYNDQAVEYSVWEPIGVFIRDRVRFAQKYLKQPDLKVFMAGAGFCPEYRLFDFPADSLHHQVVAVEQDTRIIEEIPIIYGDTKPEDLGIEYCFDSVERICQRDCYQRYFDVTLMQGVMSYYKDDNKTRTMLTHLRNVTKPGGTIIFDLQVLEPTLVRCAASMGWESDLQPDLTVKSAIKRVEKLCKEMNLSIVCEIDKTNPRPVGVRFALTVPEH